MGNLLKRWPVIDKAVDRYGYWVPFLGSVGAAMKWLFGHLTLVSDHGWAAVVLSSIAATCFVALVTSACLVAWRYFKPLPPQELLKKPDPLVGPIINPRDIVPHHETWQGRSENSFRNLDRSVFLLIANAMDLHGIQALEQAIENLPPAIGNEENDAALSAETVSLDKYERTTAENLNGTYWVDGFQRAMLVAATAAEGDLKRRTATPPFGVDAYVFRDYYIAKIKRDRSERFLSQTLAEAKSHRRQMFSMLRDQRGLHGKP